MADDISESALRLKALRKEAGLSVRAMAKALNMGATTYQHYEDRYKKKYLPYELVKPVSAILKLQGLTRESVDALSPRLSNISDEVVNITYAPLISWVQAGELAEVVDPYSVGEAESEIAIEYDRDTVLALRVRGSSINRVAPDGAIVIIDYCAQDLIPEKFYIVRKHGEATVKRYMPNPDRFEPFSTEPDHPIVFPTEDLNVVGRVIRVVTEL
jgi:SOS-response transcriptional repressor LexA